MPPPRPPPLLDCPADLLPHFLQWLSPKDPHALNLVCHDLHSIAEPLLYSSIHLRWTATHHLAIDILLRTLFHRPELAPCTQRLVLVGSNLDAGPSYNVPEKKIPVSEENLAQPIAFLERSKVRWGGDWICALRDGRMGALVAALLSQLSNLRYLEMGFKFSRDTRFIGLLFRSALCESPCSGLPRFQHLRHVSQKLPEGQSCHNRDPMTMTTGDMSHVFHLPSVENISAVLNWPMESLSSCPADHCSVAATITSLDLQYIREGVLGNLLANTPALKTLSWCCVMEEDDRRHNIVDLDQIATDLLNVRSTLQDLEITADFIIQKQNHLEERNLTLVGSLRPLVDFPCLVRYEVPMPFLLGLGRNSTPQLEQMIPRKIEHLAINDGFWVCDNFEWRDYEVFEAIRGWVSDWRAWTPQVRHFHLKLEDIEDEWHSPIRNQLEAFCLAAELQCMVTKKLGDSF